MSLKDSVSEQQNEINRRIILLDSVKNFLDEKGVKEFYFNSPITLANVDGKVTGFNFESIILNIGMNRTMDSLQTESVNQLIKEISNLPLY